MRKCIFCNKETNFSSEHVFPQWLLRYLEIGNEATYFTHANIIGNIKSQRKHSFYNLKNNSICKECNNGWMSELENKAKEYIIDLIEHKPSNKILLNSRIISIWLLKTIILLNLSSNFEKIIGEELPEIIFANKLPDNIFIDIAYLNSKKIKKINWIQSKMVGGFEFDEKLKNEATKVVNNSFKVLLQFRTVMFRVVVIQNSNLWIQGADRRDNFRLYPAASCNYIENSILEYGIKEEFYFDFLPKINKLLIEM